MERNTERFILLFISRMGAEKRDHFCLLPSSLSSFLPLLLPSIPLSFFPPFFLCFQYHWVFFFFLKLLDLGGHPPLLLLWSKWSNWQPLGFLWPELFPSPGTGSHPLSNLCGCLYILPLWQTRFFLDLIISNLGIFDFAAIKLSKCLLSQLKESAIVTLLF